MHVGYQKPRSILRFMIFIPCLSTWDSDHRLHLRSCSILVKHVVMHVILSLFQECWMLTDLSTAWQGSAGRHGVHWGGFDVVMAGRRYRMCEPDRWAESHMLVSACNT
jgi:hypothetical protein